MHPTLFFSTFLAVSLSGITSSLAQDTSVAEVTKAFRKANVTRDAGIVFHANTLLEVALPQPSGPPLLIKAGEAIQKNQTAIPPTYSIQNSTSSRAGSPFVLAMVDLDAPTPQQPTLSQVRHFLGGNFTLGQPNAQGLAQLMNSSAAISEYLQPAPTAGSDPHRYVFLLYEQSSGIDGQTLVNSSTPVTFFSIGQFARDVGLGDPIGGTFMFVSP